MAYYEKYRKNITNPEGVSYRLAIYENRTSSPGSGYPMEIGGLVGLNFVFQGQQSDVFTPIVKTSIELTLVDVSDKPTVTASPMNIKQGNWEEFFTPDATKYKVVLSTVSGTTVTPIWTGYITPDSYEEQLIYHGTIGVIARDNIGHLGDLDFDGTETESGSGMISVGDIVAQALTKVGAMSLKSMTSDFNSGNHILCQDADRALTAVNLKSLYVNLSACRGKTWLEVLESVLESTGLTLRYAFDNTFYLAEMGIIPEYLDGTRSGSVRTFMMLRGSGRRRFVPAARSIEETFDADYGGVLEVNTQSADYQDATVTMGGVSKTVHEPVGAHPFRRTGAIGMIDPLSGHYFNPRVGSIYYDGTDMFITALKSTDSVSSYGTIKASIPIVEGGVNITMHFRVFVGAYSRDGEYISGGAIFTATPGRGRRPDGNYSQGMTARYMIAFYNGTTRLYLNDQGVFQSAPYVFQDGVTQGHSTAQGRYGSDSAEVEKQIRLNNASGMLEIIFQPFLLTNNAAPSLSDGTYHGRINGLTITQDDESWKGYHILTNYSEKNNVMLSREPGFGQVSEVISPRVIQNGLYIKGVDGQFPAAGVFYWRAKDTENLRLAVLIHQQMLQYFSRTEKQLSAEIKDATDGVLSFNNIYSYGSEKYIIQSGVLDILRNTLSSVTMRTWRSWNELWGDEPVANFLTVSPSAINLTNSTSEGLQVASNTSWRIKTLPAGLTASVSSGTGTTYVVITRGTFTGTGTIVFETTDHALTASVSVTHQSQASSLSITSVGGDVENMEYPGVTGIYYVEINFDPDNDLFVQIDDPLWLHFEDPDAENGAIWTPGVYGIYCDDLPSSAPREGYINLQTAATGLEAQLYIKQIG